MSESEQSEEAISFPAEALRAPPNARALKRRFPPRVPLERKTMSKPSDTLVVVNSANRDIDVYPEPNDFVLDLKQRYEVQLISLGFLEMPYSQFLVEHAWDSFFFDVGLTFPPQDSRTLFFRAPEGKTKPIVCLPAPYTAMIFEGLRGTCGVWRVDPCVGPVNAHGLVKNSLGVIPSSIVFDPSQKPLSVSSVPSQDVVLTVGAPAGIVPGYKAVLACTSAGVRTFCSAEHLCMALNAFFSDAAIQLPLRFSYDVAQMVLLLQPQACSENVLFLEVSQPNLLGALYFPCMQGVVALQPMRSTRFPGSLERNVPIGNYDYNALRQQIDVLVNPLGQFGSIPTSKLFVNFFGESSSPPFNTVVIESVTLYDPKAVALFLSQQFLNADLPFPVRFDFEQDCFTVFCPQAFRIFWGESRLGGQLGFETDLKLDVFHRGTPRGYVSLPTRVQLQQMFGGEATQHMKTLVFQATGRLQAFQDGTVPVTLAPNGKELQIPVGTVPSEYLVAVPTEEGFIWTIATTTQAGLMPGAVSPLPNWMTNLTPLVPLPRAAIFPGTFAKPLPVFNGAVNLYFPCPPGAMQPRLAEIFGFRPGATVWPYENALNVCGSAAALVAPFHVTLEGPGYVLIELGLEHMSASITHRSGNDVKSIFFAVVAMFSNFNLERYYKAEVTSTGINVVNSFHVRIWNPWHQIYNFHGKNWNAALSFVHVTKAIRTECP